MNKVRTLITALVALAMSVSTFGLPAQAVLVPKLTLAVSGTSLSASQIANFSTTATLRLNLTVSSGEISLPVNAPTDSGAALAAGSALHGASIALVGTQRQLNDALDLASIGASCGSQVTLSGSVTLGPNLMAYNDDNGHWYMDVYVPAGIGWDDAMAAADLKTFDGTDGHGYLATITSAEENTFVNDHFPMISWLASNDRDVEGEWAWLDGPETGTLFFSGGSKVDGQYSNFNIGEPNDLNGEDYLQTWSADTWNDFGSGIGDYLVEFGGYPGDDFNSLPSAVASAEVSSPVLLTGAGTEASPFIVANESDFSHVGVCSGLGKYFTQTANISMGSSFTGLGGGFMGHYDGTGKTLDGSGASNLNGGIFGAAHGTSGVDETTIKNLAVTGFQVSGGCDSSILASEISKMTIDNVSVTGTIQRADCRSGLFATRAQDVVIKNSDARASVSTSFFVFASGALVGEAWNSTFQNIGCEFELQHDMFDPFMEEAMQIGGCVGGSNTSTYDNVSASGHILTDGQIDFMMMGTREVGGLIGRSYNDTITHTSADVSIGGSFGYALGGLVGSAYNGTTIDSSYALGSLNATESQSVGGLIGVMNGSTVTNSYSLGAVTAYSNSGALVGYASQSTIDKTYSFSHLSIQALETTHGLIGGADATTISASYWNPELVGIPGTTGALGAELPKTQDEFKLSTTFAGWNVSATPNANNVWALCTGANNGYPYLVWQEMPNGCQRTLVASTKPLITGDKYVGSTLTAVPGTWDEAATLGYQWFANGTEIGGATASTLVLTNAQLGKLVSVQVTGTRTGVSPVMLESNSFRITTVPSSKLVIIGGFSGSSTKISATTTKAITKALTGVGTIVSIKCEAFDKGKRLSASQRKIATARAKAVCTLIKAKKNAATTLLATSIGKTSDKMTAGVRVTITSVKP